MYLHGFRSQKCRPLKNPGSAGGFSLMELGIASALVAVLSTVIITGAGFIRAARQNQALELILAIHSASRQFAIRHFAGLAYGPAVNPVNTLEIARLQGDGLLPANIVHPWTRESGQIEVEPHNDNLCPQFSCIRIEMQQLDPDICEDLRTQLMERTVVEPNCNEAGGVSTLTVIMR